MSMSYRIEGYKPVDAKWTQMKQAYDACVSAGVEVPKEVMHFFNYEPPAAEGVMIELGRSGNVTFRKGITPLNQQYCDGYVVDLKELDPEIRILKFVISY